MKNLWQKYTLYLTNKAFILSLLFTLIMLAASFAVNIYAIDYATEKASNPVTDLILSNIPVFDVDGIFVWGTLIVVIFSVAVLAMNIEKVPFALKTLALFLIVRSVFTVLTHTGPFPTETERTQYDFLNKLLFGSDSFFSGHTGMPYLGALVFWDNKFIRWIYIYASIFFAIVVLMGHLHYSIDVFSAFFITYSIYRIAEVSFIKDKQVFDHGLPQV
jgi:hypothetical protein